MAKTPQEILNEMNGSGSHQYTEQEIINMNAGRKQHDGSVQGTLNSNNGVGSTSESVQEALYRNISALVSLPGKQHSYSEQDLLSIAQTNGLTLSQIAGTASETLSSFITALANLKAYYPLDEASGNAINKAPATLGTLDGTVSGATRGAAGQSGNAYSFDGINDEIAIGSVWQATYPMTMFSLFKSTDYTATRQVLLSNGDGGGAGRGQALVLSGNDTTDGSFYLLDHVIAWRDLAFKNQNNNWHMVVLVFTTSSSITSYLDGVSKGTITPPGVTVPTLNSFIGKDGGGGFFKGSLQHIGIVNGTVSGADILTMAQLAGLA